MGSVLNSKKEELKESQNYDRELQENDHAKHVINAYRQTKICRKVQKLDPEVKQNFAKQFPRKNEENNQQGQTSSIQQKDTLLLSQRTPMEDQDSECDWRDIYGEVCHSLSDGHILDCNS